MTASTLLGMTRHFAPALLLTTGLVLAQEQAPPAPSAPPPSEGATTSPSPGSSFPSPGTSTPGRDTRVPTSPFPQERERTPFPEMERPIFLSGKVVMDDGTPPPESVTIERVCNGVVRPEGYTDSKGRFSIQLGQNMQVFADASVSSQADWGGSQGGFGGNRNTGFGSPNTRGISERDLMGCELRASLAGFRSEIVNLSGRRLMDNPDVGTIIMKRLGNVEGLTISFTTLKAPKDAKKAYEKGVSNLKKKKNADALKEFEKAVQIYPKYAIAWNALGQLYQGMNRVEEARNALAKALEADPKYVNPYLHLAMISAQENNWQDVADTTTRVLKLNPVDFPQAHFYHSVASYNLHRLDAAEQSAREAVRLDERHRFPKAQHLLGIILASKQDYAGAAENIRGYIQYAPNAPDIDAAKKQLAELERQSGKAEVTQQQNQ